MSANKPNSAADWEHAFEDEGGLISVVMDAHSPQALKESVQLIIKQVLSHESVQDEAARLLGELEKIIPDDADPDALPEMKEAVARLMRIVKKDIEDTAPDGTVHQNKPKKHKKKSKKKTTFAPPKKRRQLTIPGLGKGKTPIAIPMRAVGIGAGVVFVLVVGSLILGSGSSSSKTGESLAEQMTDALKAQFAPSHHVFGGALRVGGTGDKKIVLAENVPQDACVNASWILAKRGIVSVNGLIPPTISSAVLVEYCSKGESGGATIKWTVKKKE